MSDSLISGELKQIYRSSAPYSGGLRCGGGACPAVFQREDGAILIVGRRLSAAEKSALPMDVIEDALEVPADVLHGAIAKLTQ
jgi:hypothetical protein